MKLWPAVDMQYNNIKSSAQAKELIRREILAGELPPGARVKVGEIAARYGIGQMPVREALLQLEGEGLIEIFAHRGAVVRRVDAKFIYDMYELRRVLEVMLVKNAAIRFRADDVARLKIARDAWEAGADRGDPEEMLQANMAFHKVINVAGDNPEAERIVHRGWDLVHALRLQYGFGASRLSIIMAEHRALTEALESRDSARAATIADQHCQTARDDLLAQMV